MSDSAPQLTPTPAIDRLLATPSRFDFFQAVRSLERAAREGAKGAKGVKGVKGVNGANDAYGVNVAPIGADGPPSAEPVRFHATPGLGFPGSAIVSVTLPAVERDSVGSALADASTSTAAPLQESTIPSAEADPKWAEADSVGSALADANAPTAEPLRQTTIPSAKADPKWAEADSVGSALADANAPTAEPLRQTTIPSAKADPTWVDAKSPHPNPLPEYGSTALAAGQEWEQEQGVTRGAQDDGAEQAKAPPPSPAEMHVTFMALAGAVGVLPDHYASLIIERGRSNDTGFRDFLDLFNHRLISLFYNSWEKYRFEVAYERWKAESSSEQQGDGAIPWQDLDGFTSALLSLIGLGTRGLQGRLAFDDHVTLLYAGHLAHRPRNAAGLELIVADFLGMPAQVMQFVGQWLVLEDEECTRLVSLRDNFARGRDSGHVGSASADARVGTRIASAEADPTRTPKTPAATGAGDVPRHGPGLNQLGVSCVLGKRVWDIQGQFRLRIGPLSYAHYCQLLPESRGLAGVVDLARLYAGGEFGFDVQPVLRADEVPPVQLGAPPVQSKNPPPKLGRNVWLCSRPASKAFDGAIFPGSKN